MKVKIRNKKEEKKTIGNEKKEDKRQKYVLEICKEKKADFFSMQFGICCINRVSLTISKSTV